MLSARNIVRIMNLGDIVTIDIRKVIQAFTSVIASKISSVNSEEIGKAVAGVLHKNMDKLNDFKHGVMNENDFTGYMISQLEAATSVRLTNKEFDDAWNSMNPKFQQFKDELLAVAAFNRIPGHRVIFISATNPKDIRHLVSELESNKIDYKVVDECLVEIDGIKLHTTYAARQTKAQLIEHVIKSQSTKPSSTSSLSCSLGALMSSTQLSEPEPTDIKYVRGVNNIQDPVLREELDSVNKQLEMKAETFKVETIIWMKQEKSLSDVLSDEKPVSRPVTVNYL